MDKSGNVFLYMNFHIFCTNITTIERRRGYICFLQIVSGHLTVNPSRNGFHVLMSVTTKTILIENAKSAIFPLKTQSSHFCCLLPQQCCHHTSFNLYAELFEQKIPQQRCIIAMSSHENVCI